MLRIGTAAWPAADSTISPPLAGAEWPWHDLTCTVEDRLTAGRPALNGQYAHQCGSAKGDPIDRRGLFWSSHTRMAIMAMATSHAGPWAVCQSHFQALLLLCVPLCMPCSDLTDRLSVSPWQSLQRTTRRLPIPLASPLQSILQCLHCGPLFFAYSSTKTASLACRGPEAI